VPVYQYRCRTCRAEREEIQTMGAGPPGPCTECGGELRRVYGRVAVSFGGWGFRRTDSLVPDDRPRKDFKQLREKGEEIAEG
jgi:putative FmdB family regulatory protein